MVTAVTLFDNYGIYDILFADEPWEVRMKGRVLEFPVGRSVDARGYDTITFLIAVPVAISAVFGPGALLAVMKWYVQYCLFVTVFFGTPLITYALLERFFGKE